jgi:hypothetical protein
VKSSAILFITIIISRMPQGYQPINGSRRVENGSPFNIIRQPSIPVPAPTEQVTDANRGVILSTFMLISLATALCAAFCFVAVISYVAILFGDNLILSIDDMIRTIVLFFEILLCIFVVFVEMEWTEAVRSISLLQSWSVRGLCYIFVGLVIFEDLGGVPHTVLNSKKVGYLVIPSLAISAFGLIYAVMVSDNDSLLFGKRRC